MPARAAGSLQVGVSNLSNARSAQANLAVTTATLRSAFVPAPANDSKNSIVYDPSRHAVFAVSYYGNTLQRFKWEGGNTWALTAVPWSGIWRVQMAPDRRTLYVLATDGLYEVDPETLATKVKHAAPDGQNFFRGFYFDEPLPLTNDLRLWLPQSGGQYFDLQLGSYQFAADSEFGNVGYEQLTATPDGAHLYTLEGSYTPKPPDGWYSTASHATAPIPASVQSAYRTHFDLQGAIGIFDSNAVYRTADWSLVGTIQAPAGERLLPGARVSPDGTRAYVLASGNGTNNAERVDVFDLTKLDPGTANLLLLGTIPIADPATACYGEYECDVLGRLAIDPVGKTLFWSGNAGFTVIPIPDALAGRAGTREAAHTLRLQPAAIGKPKPTVH
jgi:DNA-binding beta-propeller fold protein YncE